MDQALSLDVLPTERDLLYDAHPLRVPELLELVLFFVTENFEDRDSLRTCTLVNADWKAIAQPRLFTNTLLKVQRMPWHNREAMRALPSVLPLLRKLAISNTKFERDMTPTGDTQGRIVMKFSHQVTSTGFDVVAAWKPDVFLCTALVLTSCTFSSFAVLREILAGLPDLVDLELNLEADSLECVDEERMVADVPPGVALRTLKCLDRHNAMVLDPLLRWMVTAERVCLESVAIEIYDQAVLDALRALLHVGISTVRELEVMISPLGLLARCSAVQLSNWIPARSRLELLHLTTGYADMHDIVDAVSLPCLRVLKINCIDTRITPADLRSEDVIARLQVPKLKHVEVGILVLNGALVSEQQLLRSFASAANRGILQADVDKGDSDEFCVIV